MNRPTNWTRMIDAESETCYWLAPDGTRHPGTEEENKDVRAELLEMRVKGDKVMRDQSERHY